MSFRPRSNEGIKRGSSAKNLTRGLVSTTLNRGMSCINLRRAPPPSTNGLQPFTGFLIKESSGMIKKWKRKYFVLKDGQLAYFKHDSAKKAIKSFSIVRAEVRIQNDKKKERLFVIATESGKKLNLEAPTDDELHQWMTALRAHGADTGDYVAPAPLSNNGTSSHLRTGSASFRSTTSATTASQSLPGTSSGTAEFTSSDGDIEDEEFMKRLQLVLQKIEDNKIYFQNKDSEKLARNLCNKTYLRKTYLNINTEAIARLIQILDKEKSAQDEALEAELDPDSSLDSNLMHQRQTKHMKVKLVISEMPNNSRSIRQLLSPVLNAIPNLRKEFGMFHTALIIGPWYLEWTDSSLVIPRRIGSRMAFIAADLHELASRNDFADLADTIADVVVDWNVNYLYKNISLSSNHPDKKVGNCQDFVEAMLKALNINFDFNSGALGNFISDIRQYGNCEMKFKPSVDFKKRFQIFEKSMTFDSHAELDTFVDDIMSVCPNFLLDFKDEYTLLKAFDRAYWLRHMKKASVSQFKPLSKTNSAGESQCCCPFGDPRDTTSFQR